MNNHYYAGLICSPDGITSGIIGLYTNESNVIRKIVKWIIKHDSSYSDRSYSFLPINLEGSQLDIFLNLTTHVDLLNFLKQHSPNWHSFGAGWYICVDKLNVIA